MIIISVLVGIVAAAGIGLKQPVWVFVFREI